MQIGIGHMLIGHMTIGPMTTGHWTFGQLTSGHLTFPQLHSNIHSQYIPNIKVHNGSNHTQYLLWTIKPKPALDN